MSAPRSPVEAETANGGATPPARAPASGLHSGAEAANIALAPLTHREAPRIGVLGDSGTGKTHAMRCLIAAYLKKSPTGVVLIVDDKDPRAPQFPGQVRRDVLELNKRPAEPEPRIVVFRGNPMATDETRLDPEEIAGLQARLVEKGRPSLVVYDELDRAADAGQWRAGKKSRIAWAFGKGRSLGAASLWGTQETEAVPREAFNQSSAILCFRMMGNPLRLLGRRGYLEGGAASVIPSLPGDDVPPARRGVFVLLRRGKPWDRKFYRSGVS